MRKFAIVTIALLLGLAVRAQVRFGVVDAPAIFADMPEMAEARDQIASASADYQHELEEMRAELQKKYADYQAIANSSALETIKERRIQEIQELDQRIQRFVATAAQSMESLQQQLLEPIRSRLSDAIKTVGHQGGFTMVYADLSVGSAYGTPTGLEPVYISDEVVDLTSRVRALLALPAPTEE